VRVASAIRGAADPELPLVVEVLRRAGFGTQVARLLEYPRRSPDGEILVANAEDGVVGVACIASFGATGWIGALGVAPEARRRGLGAALTEASVARLRARDAQCTVLLYATEAGRPVYERLGFVAEGRAVAWRGVAGAGPPTELQRLGPADRDDLRALDRAVTGERRDAVLDAIDPLTGVATATGGAREGWAIASPWGAGTAIGARSPEDGVALMAAATAGPAAGTLIVPETNEAAVDALRGWRFVRLNDALRMRLGPAVDWQPERQFGLFNLFWG
jgi:GNAT superfamily N-acetyltransferase